MFKKGTKQINNLTLDCTSFGVSLPMKSQVRQLYLIFRKSKVICILISMEGQLGELLSKLSSYNEVKPIPSTDEPSAKKETSSREKKVRLKTLFLMVDLL